MQEIEIIKAFEGVVTEVNPNTGFIHLSSKSKKLAISIVDRPDKYRVGDTLKIHGNFRLEPVERHLRKNYEIPDSEVDSWRHSIASYVRVVEHKHKKTILDEAPTKAMIKKSPDLDRIFQFNKLNTVVKVSPIQTAQGTQPKPSTLESALVGTFWRDTETQSLVEILSLGKDQEGFWVAKVKYHELGTKKRRDVNLNLSRIFACYQQVQSPA